MATTTNNGWETPDDTDLVKDGALAMRTLGNAIDTSTGTGLLAWTSYTPTFTNFTLGTGTITLAKYVKLGKTVHMKVLITLGGSSVVSGRIGVSLPVTATGDNLDRITNTCGLIAGAIATTGFVTIGSSTRADLYALVANQTYVQNSNTASNIPAIWTTGNSFSFTLTYEAA